MFLRSTLGTLLTDNAIALALDDGQVIEIAAFPWRHVDGEHGARMTVGPIDRI